MNGSIFTKNFILMFLSNLLICSGFYMLMPIFPAYAINDLGIDKSKVGIIIGVFSISAVFFRPLAGTLLDSIGRMVIYIPSLILFSLCSGGYFLVNGIALLVIIRIIHGISWAGVGTANSTIIADIVPQHLRGRGIGYFGLSMSIAMALGPAFGTFLIHYLTIKQIFLVCMLVSLTALFASVFIKFPKIKTEKIWSLNVSALFEKKVLGIAFIEFCIGFIYAGVLSFAALHAMDLKITALGSFFVIYAVAIAFTRIFGGRMMDKRGPSRLIISGLFLMCIGCICLAFAQGSVLFLTAAALSGMGVGLLFPTLMTMTVNVVEPNRRGAASATLLMALDIGVGSGAIVLAIAADRFGYIGMYIFSAAVTLLPLAWYILSERKRYFILFQKINAANKA